MENNNNLLHEELVILSYEAKTSEEVLRGLSCILREKGYVKESYTQAIIDREKVFPTGLNTEGVKVAIPHTDAKHVEKPAILVAKLKEPVSFKEMANGVNDVDAKLIFMLAIKNPDEQVKTLSKLMSIFSNKDALLGIYNAASKSEIIKLLSNVLSD